MKDLDKTKKNIKLSELNENQKKELFNKFKNAGGEVISEREARRNLIIDRDKQRQHQRKLDDHFSSMKTSQDKSFSNNLKPISVKKAIKGTTNITDSPFNKFRIRMKLRFFGVTGFNTQFFSEKFLDKFTGQYKTSLITLQMSYLSLFKKEPTTGERVISRLDKISPLYYDVIQRAGEIFEPIIIDQITENYRNYPNVPQPIAELKDPLFIIFRSLYILKPYENTLINAFEKAIDLFEQVSDNRDSKILKKKDIRNSLFIIFDKIYPRLHLLFCQYYGILFDEIDKRIEDLLAITPAEKPGVKIRTKRNSMQEYPEPSSPTDDKKNDADVEEKFESLLDATIKEGLRLMYKLDFNTLRKMYDKKGRFELITESDKTLLAYLYFLEFENEYSIILTTKKINFNTDFSSERKNNYKETLQDLFNNMRKCHEAFNFYYDAFGTFNLVKNDRPVLNEQYIPYSKRLDEALARKNELGSHCRHIIRVFMNKVSDVLTELITDMNEKQRYINNPQDSLDIQYEIEGDKKLKDKKIYNAIQIVQRYAAALAFRLGHGGDLTGNSEFTDEKSGKQSDSIKDKSVLDELDDIM